MLAHDSGGSVIEWGIHLMSHNHGADWAPPSRRSVVKGAAWAVPAVVVAGAAPTVAASAGPLSFSGGACKLPGNANDIFKGYVFELIAVNSPGPGPTTGVTVITNVKINGVAVTGYQVVVKTGDTCTCATCTPPGSTVCNTFCTPDATSSAHLRLHQQPGQQPEHLVQPGLPALRVQHLRRDRPGAGLHLERRALDASGHQRRRLVQHPGCGASAPLNAACA